MRPYYIYRVRPFRGIEHFRTSVGKGVEIIGIPPRSHFWYGCCAHVHRRCSGGRQDPIMPNYVISRSDRKVILRNYEGVIVVYSGTEEHVSYQRGYITTRNMKSARKPFQGRDWPNSSMERSFHRAGRSPQEGIVPSCGRVSNRGGSFDGAFCLSRRNDSTSLRLGAHLFPLLSRKDAVEYTYAWLKKNDLPAELHHFSEDKITRFHGANVIGRLSGDENGPTVLLNGHLDTVRDL